MVVARGGQGGLVDEQRDVGAGGARDGGGDPLEVDVIGERHVLGVDLEDLDAARLVGRVDRDAAVEAARAKQRGVEDLGAVGRAEDDHVRARLEAVHLGEDLVERLLALVVAAADAGVVARARAADRVELVDEDDRRRRLLRLLEEVADAGGPHPHDRLDELARGEVEEGGVRLAGDGAGEQGLAGPRRPVEQDAVRDPGPDLRVARRVPQEVDDFDQLVLGLVDAGHVLEVDSLLLIGIDAPGVGAAEAAEDAAPSRSGLAAGDPDEEADDEQPRQEAEDEGPEDRAAGIRRLGVDRHARLGEDVGELGVIDERGDLGLELVDLEGLVTAGRVVARLVLQLPLDRVALRADLADVLRLDLVDEERLVGDARAVRRAAGQEGDEEIDG